VRALYRPGTVEWLSTESSEHSVEHVKDDPCSRQDQRNNNSLVLLLLLSLLFSTSQWSAGYWFTVAIVTASPFGCSPFRGESLSASDGPESCAGGITAIGRGCHAGEVEGERPD
jgi:hypothetical protein